MVSSSAAHLAVDADADETGGAGVVEHVLVLALLVDDAGREEHEARAVPGEDGLGYLLRRLVLHGPAAAVAVGASDAGEQEAEVVVHLGDGADGGARVVGDALLVDGDGGGEALDVLDVRLVHAPEELARVGGERLDVASLALGVDGVEGERGLAGAGRAGDHDEPVAGDGDVYVLEVVLASAANHDAFEGHGTLRWEVSRGAFPAIEAGCATGLDGITWNGARGIALRSW